MTHKSSDLIGRYKRSIFFDSLICMFPMVIFGLSFSSFNFISQDYMFLAFSCIGIASTILYFFLDIIFLKRSPGKRLFRIAIVHQTETRKMQFFMYLYRRFLELSIHTFFTKNFSDKCKFIDRVTNSRIDSIDYCEI
jgi:hypothetical protein